MKYTCKYERTDLVKAGLRFFFSLSRRWELAVSDEASLIGISIDEILELKRAMSIDKELSFTSEIIERLSLIAGIQKNLELLYSADSAERVIKRSCKKFHGMSLLEYMLKGDLINLREVRRYLDSCLGCHFL